ncbi:hypothetical protein AX16_006201 [Volvariella volvacea WC 439]|nr:hypothetical protein AX16_006201 [Volvariella volvacea WC 439]
MTPSLQVPEPPALEDEVAVIETAEDDGTSDFVEANLSHAELTAETVAPSETESIASDDTAIEPMDLDNALNTPSIPNIVDTMAPKKKQSQWRGAQAKQQQNQQKDQKQQGKQQTAGKESQGVQEAAKPASETREDTQVTPKDIQETGPEANNEETPAPNSDDAAPTGDDQEEQVPLKVEEPDESNNEVKKESTTKENGSAGIEGEGKAAGHDTATSQDSRPEHGNGHASLGSDDVNSTTTDSGHLGIHTNGHANGHATPSPTSATTAVGGFAFGGWGSPIDFEDDPEGVLQDFDELKRLEMVIAEQQRKREAIVARANDKVWKGALDKLEATAVKRLREDIETQARHHKEAIQEIEVMLANFEFNGIVQQLRKEVEDEVNRQIEAVVKQQVAEYLQKLPTVQMQAPEIDQVEKELLAKKRELHNLESRRLNRCIDPANKDKQLHTMLMTNGKVSKHFPKTCGEIQKLSMEDSQELLKDYGIQTSSIKREENINRFMLFCGIDYVLGSQPVGY